MFNYSKIEVVEKYQQVCPLKIKEKLSVLHLNTILSLLDIWNTRGNRTKTHASFPVFYFYYNCDDTKIFRLEIGIL